MIKPSILAIAATISTVAAQSKGFNYGATNTDGSVKIQAQFQNEFTTAQGLTGAPGFTSARLYTMIQGGTTNSPISAIPAAIATKTSLLLGIWASAGQDTINNEIAALTAAISQYGTAFTDLIVGISIGSEDLYRISTFGIGNLSGPGASPDVIVNYINQVRQAIANTAASGKPIGHVDTWTAWVNSSNSAVIGVSDFIGMDAYPYYQNTMPNDISQASSLFSSAYQQTVSVAGGKPVWVTETGWPVSGPTENQAVANVANAKSYWNSIGCGALFSKINTWWFQLDDYPSGSTPAFGVVGNSVSTTPLYDLSCSSSSYVFNSSYISSVPASQAISGASKPILSQNSQVTTSAGGASPLPAQASSPNGTKQPIIQSLDGQIQAPSASAGGAGAGAGSTQAPSPNGTKQPVTQIADGQVQASGPAGGAATGASQAPAPNATKQPVTQISDGQVQAPGSAAGGANAGTIGTKQPVTQGTDGQINPSGAQSSVPTNIVSDQQRTTVIVTERRTRTTQPVTFKTITKKANPGGVGPYSFTYGGLSGTESGLYASYSSQYANNNNNGASNNGNNNAGNSASNGSNNGVASTAGASNGGANNGGSSNAGGNNSGAATGAATGAASNGASNGASSGASNGINNGAASTGGASNAGASNGGSTSGFAASAASAVSTASIASPVQAAAQSSPVASSSQAASTVASNSNSNSNSYYSSLYASYSTQYASNSGSSATSAAPAASSSPVASQVNSGSAQVASQANSGSARTASQENSGSAQTASQENSGSAQAASPLQSASPSSVASQVASSSPTASPVVSNANSNSNSNSNSYYSSLYASYSSYYNSNSGSTTASSVSVASSPAASPLNSSIQASAQASSVPVSSASPAISASQSSAAQLSPVSATLSSATASAQESPVSATPSSALASAQASPSNCPVNLSGTWEFPHLIVPVSQSNPTKAYGTGYNGTFNSDISTIFNFDLGSSYLGKTCSLIFLFPTQAQLQTSSYTISGSGGLDIYQLNPVADASVTYNSVPAASKLGSIAGVQPGNSYLVASASCAAGSSVSYEFKANGNLDLNYFQDYNPSPIGAFISVCN